jgi:hypothetical protein
LTDAKRGGWKALIFAQKHNLGDPVAGNFYQVLHYYIANFKTEKAEKQFYL